MKLQETFVHQKYNTMKLRARNMSTKPKNILEEQVETMSNLILLITNQRDRLQSELLDYRKTITNQDAMLERQTARIVELQEHIENFDGEDR
jgi:hypothetical protein